jgi:hypothetical protein
MNLRTVSYMMIGVAALLSGVVAGARGQAANEYVDAATTRFSWVDVYVDSGDWPLAAYQIELGATAGDFRIVGVEGGDDPAFAEPPFYDPAALQAGRVILAAYSVEDELPTGRIRVARVHVMLDGPTPEFAAWLDVAATVDGGRLDVQVDVVEGD